MDFTNTYAALELGAGQVHRMQVVDCVVVGAGVIGLAVARSLAMGGRETLILERHDAFGTESSSRNSEVVHAGIYYAPGSLKARLCVLGRETLFEYCRKHGVAHRRCGKLIVATAVRQHAQLEEIARVAERNGVSDLQWLDRREALRLEPHLRCDSALLSPSTGIVDSHALMLSLLGEAEQHGAVLVLRSQVAGISLNRGLAKLRIGEDGDDQVTTRWIVNAAG